MKVFIVDDDAVLRMVMADNLARPGREVREFGSGQALLVADDEAPDVILMDVEMPGMDGIAACRAWRAEAHAADTQIIFISAHDDLDMRLAAYDAGGNDYVVKPIEMAELQRKVQVAEDLIAHRRTLAEQASFAGQTAFTALSTIGEMGIIQQFMRESFAAASVDALAKALFGALQQYGLSGLVEFRMGGIEPYRYSDQGECTPLEVALLGHAAKMERIFQFRDRMAINYPAVTLLLSGLPLDNPDRVGRLRDHLAIVTEGVSTRLKALGDERVKAMQSMGISEAISGLAQALEDIERNQAASRLRAEVIDSEFLREQNHAFVYLGLSAEQENMLIDIAQRTHDELAVLRDQDGAVSERLHAITKQLRSLIGA